MMIDTKKELDIFDLRKKTLLSENCKSRNGMYGVEYSILNYIGEDYNKACITCPFEHGLTISNKFLSAYEHTNNSNYIITNGLYNKNKITKISDKNVIMIGPYITYAKSIFSEERLLEIKHKNGRTLLIFPTHGITGFEPRFDMSKFLDEIKKASSNFETIVVCMYYHDVICNYHKQYKKEGYKVVSAGNGRNKFFLNKLKSIIQLSDAVIANNYTTGLQYAICLNKPVYIVKNLDFKWKNSSFNNVDKFDADLYDSYSLETFLQICDDPTFNNLQKQREWGNYMFGLDQVKNREELCSLLTPVIRRL